MKSLFVALSDNRLISFIFCYLYVVELTANFANKTVSVKQTGPNDSGLNGALIGMGLEEKAKPGDLVNVLLGEIEYKVVFTGLGDGSVDAEAEELSVDEGKAKPTKIPKMFLNKGTNEFKKDSLIAKGTWENKDQKNNLFVYVSGEDLKEPKTNVRLDFYNGMTRGLKIYVAYVEYVW
jgi:hypothetical protein